MSRLMFVYLSGSEKGKTRIFTQNHVSIGSSDNCDLKLVPDDGAVLPEGVLAEVYDDDGAFHLVRAEGIEQLDISVNGEDIPPGETIAGQLLKDGDTIQFGHAAATASVLFQVMPDNFAASSLVRRNGRELEDRAGAGRVHPLTATLFVKELTASLWAEVPRRAKIIGFASVGVIALFFLGGVVFFFHTQYQNTSGLEDLRLETAREREAREQSQLIIRKQQEEIDRLRDQAEQTLRFTQRISERYSPAVCLIVGSYSFVERGTGRALRYDTADDSNETLVDPAGNPQASIEGAGPPVQIDFTGTGFLVAEGLIVTNKHVVQPWESDQIAQIILAQSGNLRPRMDTLFAFFPSMQSPFPLRSVRPSDRFDLALCRFEQGDAALPIIPLSNAEPTSLRGESVVLLGYPTGVDGLLQRIDDNERKAILSARSQSIEDVAAGLSSLGLVRPLTTTGTITDALPGRLVHSAQTAEGGSGSPLFNQQGEVIGINSAILVTSDGLQSFGGSNFGVPGSVAVELVESYRREIARRP